MPTNSGNVRYSFVIPIYNEEAVLPQLVHRISALIEKLDSPAEVVFVDDGSSDTSAIFLRGMISDHPEFRLIELSRNFGHQIAISAGMDVARGDAIIVMDADLQDPPEVVLDLIAKWKEGYEIVYARRIKREGETFFKRATASLFYRFLSVMTSVNIPKDVGDFRLVGRRALDAFRAMPERDRFVRGMFAWIGFPQTEVLYERPPRAAGETKYPFWKMLRLAVHAIVSFSEKPLRFALWLGIAVSFCAALFGVYAVMSKIFTSGVISGWTSTVVIISFLTGINLFMTGVVGLYVGGIYAEVKKRPLYVIKNDSAALDTGIATAASRRNASDARIS
jgi:dolichol-phosphate mannosyltransferase